MAKLTEKEKKEFLELTESKNIKNDFEKMRKNTYKFFLSGKDQFDIDKYIEFLNFFNEFVNHTPKKFQKIIADKNIL